MNERERHQVLEAEPEQAAPATPTSTEHPLLDLQRRAGNRAARRMVQPKLTIGHAGDAHEQEADRVAADVMRRLQGGDGGGAAPGPVAAPQLQAKSADPLGGMPVPDDIEGQITSSSGRPMDPATSARMGGAFGADFSGVRIHDGAQDGAMAESMQAHAFTTGNDVFFKPGGYDPSSAGGQELLAHELTHVVQQKSAVATRQINRFIDVKTFEKRTSEGTFTGKSTAQKEIVKKLTAYAALGAKNDKGQIVIPDNKLKQAVSLITDMKEAANLWIGAHTLDETDESSGKTTTTVDPKRQNRAAGMAWFFMAADSELGSLENRINTAASAVEQDEVVTDPKGALKLKEHYQGNLSSSLRMIGTLIDKVAPNDGDSTELSVDLKIPVQPGVFIGGTLGLEVEKDGNVEVSCEAAFQAGGSAGVAEIAGALGGYIKAGGPNGEGVMKLVSYGFYRRVKESEIIPAQIASIIWGGGTSEFAKKKANKWSLEIEKELLGEGEDGEENDNFVELGGLASVGVEADLGAADLEAEAKYSSGKRYDSKSMEARKGGAGEDNKGSDSFMTKNISSKFGKGAEKSTGRSTHNLDLSFAASVLGGALAGELGFSASWRDQGRHKAEREGKTDNVQLEDMEFTFSVTGSVPTDGIAAKLLEMAEQASDEAKKDAKKAAAKAAGEEDAPTTELAQAQAEAAAAFDGIKSLPFSEWFDAATADGGGEGAESIIETDGSVGLELALGIEKADAGWDGSVELKHVKSKSMKLPELLEIELIRKKRLGKAEYKSGAGWS